MEEAGDCDFEWYVGVDVEVNGDDDEVDDDIDGRLEGCWEDRDDWDIDYGDSRWPDCTLIQIILFLMIIKLNKSFIQTQSVFHVQLYKWIHQYFLQG